jgi:transcriptional regulator with XRE-family HTH domain
MTNNEQKNSQNYLPEVIRTVRKFWGLKQSEIAEKLNVNQSTYSKIERGLVSTSAERWLMFAHVLNLNFDAPLTGFIEVQAPDNAKGPCGGTSCYSGRIFFVLQRILNREGYNSRVQVFLKKNNIDPDYFRINHHYVSSDVIHALLTELSLIGVPGFFLNKMNSTDRELLIGKDVLRSKSRWGLFDTLASNPGHLGKSFDFKIEHTFDSARFTMSTTDQKVGPVMLALLNEAIESEMMKSKPDVLIKSKSSCDTLIRFDIEKVVLS